MIDGLFRFVFGYCAAAVDGCRPLYIRNLLLSNKIVYTDFRENDGGVSFIVSSFAKKRLAALFAKEGIEARYSDRGLFFRAMRYRHRIGIAIGILIFIAVCALSERFLWNIEIIGNDRVSDAEIIAGLEKQGCVIGAFVPGLDVKKIQNRFLEESDDVAYIAVNLRGNVARVVVREFDFPPEVRENQLVNIVASKNGFIESIFVDSGVAAVNAGSAVKAGDLLISGVYDSSDRLPVTASGRVYARTTERFSVEVSTTGTKKAYTGRENRSYVIKIFSKEINICSNSGNSYAVCDKIIDVYVPEIFGVVIPVFRLTSVVESEYENVNEILTEAQAASLAYAELDRRADELLADAQLLKKTVSAGFTENGEAYHIDCEMELIENIAVLSPIVTE